MSTYLCLPTRAPAQMIATNFIRTFPISLFLALSFSYTFADFDSAENYYYFFVISQVYIHILLYKCDNTMRHQRITKIYYFLCYCMSTLILTITQFLSPKIFKITSKIPLSHHPKSKQSSINCE
jgi:hypothetical protein